MDLVAAPLLQTAGCRRRARSLRRRQAKRWGSWPGDLGDLCSWAGDGIAGAALEGLSGHNAGGGNLDREGNSRELRDRLARSRSVKDQLGATRSEKGSASDLRALRRKWREERRHFLRLVEEQQRLTDEGPLTAGSISHAPLWRLLVWGPVVVACLLLWVQWGAYLGGHQENPWRGLAGAAAVTAVPLTYTLGGPWRFPHAWRLWQPFQGGARFVLLQGGAWFFWAWALAPFVMPLGIDPPAKAGSRCTKVPQLPPVHLAFSAVACALAQILTSASLHVFTPDSKIWPPQLRSPPARHRGMRSSFEAASYASAAALWAQSGRLYQALMSVNISLATLVCGAAVVCDILFHGGAIGSALPSSKHVLVAAAGFASLAIIAPSTYGLGGSLRYRHSWSFWQPFVGGLSFVVIQALAWALFAAALAAFLLAAYCATALTSSRLGNGLLASAGFGGLASEILMAASLLCYVAPQQSKKLKQQRFEEAQIAAGAQTPVSVVSDTTLCTETAFFQLDDGCSMAVEAPLSPLQGVTSTDCMQAVALPAHWMAQQARDKSLVPGELGLVSRYVWTQVKVYGVLALFYCHHLFIIAAICLSLVLGWQYVAALGVAFLAYLPTYWGSPQTTGRRVWRSARDKLCALLEEVAIHHWGGLRLVRTSKQPLDSSQAYVFGYHPHGMFPVTAAWFHYTTAWRRLFPGIRPVSLAATVVFRAPIVRDLMLWAGNREVSRKGFQNALTEERAVVLCPGGQSELCLHQPHDRKKFVLCARKKGFIRLAMQKGAALVPIFCFGESFLMNNLFDWPAVQRWTYRKIGFPVPFFPVGLWGALPLPRRGAMTIVVGEAIPTRSPCEAAVRGSNRLRPTEEEVEAMRIRYFQALKDLFEAHKAKHGYADFQLELHQS